MKKINFDMGNEDDDYEFIQLLGLIDLEEPSETFTNRTLSRFSVERSPVVYLHKHLKLPLLLMLTLAALLFLPLLLGNIEEASFVGLIQDFHPTTRTISPDLKQWYLIYPMCLILILILLTHVHMRLTSLQKINK